MQKKLLYLLAGANGSGKSTLASELLPSESLDFLNADEIAKEICPEDISSVKIKAGKIVLRKLEALLQSGKSFAIETTLAGKNHIKIIQKAKELGYYVILAYCYLDNPEMNSMRVKVRVLKGGHDIPHPDIVRRYHRSRENFWNIYKEIVDEWTLYYNGMTSYTVVAENTNGQLEILNEVLYNDFVKDFG